MWTLKRNDTNKFTYKTQRNSQKTNLWLLGGRDSQGFGEDHVCTAIFKMDNEQKLLCSTWNSAQCYVSAWMGGGFEGEWIHVYVSLTLCCSPETTTTLLIKYNPIQIKKFKVQDEKVKNTKTLFNIRK